MLGPVSHKQALSQSGASGEMFWGQISTQWKQAEDGVSSPPPGLCRGSPQEVSASARTPNPKGPIWFGIGAE